MLFLRTPRMPSLVPTGAMAQLAFLLLLFLVVTTIQQVDPTAVALPDSRARVEARKGAALVVLHRDAGGGLGYRLSDGTAAGHDVAVGQLHDEVSTIVQADPDRQFVLRADGTVHFEKIDELLDELRTAGVRTVLLETRQRAEREAP
jgi:biopolymer transport protein ExbD